jgi:hypothetical protein
MQQNQRMRDIELDYEDNERIQQAIRTNEEREGRLRNSKYSQFATSQITGHPSVAKS